MYKTRTRGSRLSSRPFYTTLFLLTLFAAISFLSHTYQRRDRHIPSLDLGLDIGLDHDHDHDHGLSFDDSTSALGVLGKRSKSLECEDVHHAQDQCAFVKENCHDEDAGLIPYLRFYYCGMSQVKSIGFAMLVVWLGLLFSTIGIAASDFFSVNLSTIATILGLSESLAGVTFLAFGNGSPDVFSTFAAMSSNSASMAVGELIGAACFITGVVAGSMALVREFRVDKKTYARDICFFIVAVCFSMVFLADGSLRFFECCIMIGYYIVYVITVVAQHWYLSRRRHRQRREGAARSHVYGSVGAYTDELAGEPYRDDPDDVDAQRSRPHSSGTADISNLEHGPRIEVEGQPAAHDGPADEADEEDHERLVAAEVARSMRVLRTGPKRRNTINPIRPSLVGALEFRSALAQLQRESNLKMSPIHTHQGHGRSLSEAYLPPNARVRSASSHSDVNVRAPHNIAIPDQPESGRHRALSSGATPTSATLLPELAGQNPNITVSQEQPSEDSTRSNTPAPSFQIGGNLAPPPTGPGQVPSSGSVSPFSGGPHSRPDMLTPDLRLQIPSRRSSQSDASSPASPFPMYTDSPMMLTPQGHNDPADFMLPGPAQRDLPFEDLQIPLEQPKPVSWWPYSVLPPPHVLFATLFPTLQGWREKSIWDKLVSFISVPSIFLLVITLPVVENESSEEDAMIDPITDTPVMPYGTSQVNLPGVVEQARGQPESEWERYRRHSRSRGSTHSSRAPTPPLVTLENEETLVAPPAPGFPHVPRSSLDPKTASDIPSVSCANDETLSWNRWLVCLQLFTGPLFSVFILWANFYEEFEYPGRTIAKLILYTLLGSLVLLGITLFYTSEQRKPKYHYILCFLGFIISIAWISTIAGEVVGVLKAVGIILGISEALLGLTIFAAGNSVGDLIANITVARLGYPVMAL